MISTNRLPSPFTPGGTARGFSLLELMVSMSLALLLLSLMTRYWANLSHRQQQLQQTAQLNANGRFFSYYAITQFDQAVTYHRDDNPSAMAITVRELSRKQRRAWSIPAASDTLSFRYQAPATPKASAHWLSWYLAKSPHRTQDGHRVLALYQKTDDQRRLELIRGVGALSVRYYTLKANGHYQEQATITASDTVYAINIRIVLVTEMPQYRKSQPYQFMDHTFANPRGYGYQTWEIYLAAPTT